MAPWLVRGAIWALGALWARSEIENVFSDAKKDVGKVGGAVAGTAVDALAEEYQRRLLWALLAVGAGIALALFFFANKDARR